MTKSFRTFQLFRSELFSGFTPNISAASLRTFQRLHSGLYARHWDWGHPPRFRCNSHVLSPQHRLRCGIRL